MFQIDFFEFCFLVEACIPPRPIARAMFWNKVIDQYHTQLTTDQRGRLFDWINKCDSFQRGIADRNEQCLLFRARFDPRNQFVICWKLSSGESGQHDCFMYNGRFHTHSNTSIQDEYITDKYPLGTF